LVPTRDMNGLGPAYYDPPAIVYGPPPANENRTPVCDVPTSFSTLAVKVS
jgi:hypothetical protein